ncbi:MFS general substrate transporter [Mollisia scopiformis]|uniref:MFS general substrate transporter n=1 Tax=Mollisia scopiformis TaxID=149040 RepID=A0A194WTG3_MOLSC|nr:MFS general substrate transporter [Mollisia scopiformis]KUJ11253.1 MFS general substrate transporter [Mollisia scopiformis]
MSFWKGYQGRRAYEDLLEGNPDGETLKGKLLEIIEPHGFKWRVFIVAGSGFLADAYAIFSPNVISPALAYIYWNQDTLGTKGMIINVVTLLGSCIGMVFFGFLADYFGRKRLYGVELVIGIIATLGLTQVSAGYNQASMNAFAWIVWWRLVLGIAIGAEYPLSALIAAEWSATSTRGTMLAAVFMMQPFGQFLAYIVGLAALQGITKSRIPDPTAIVSQFDAVWRCIIGVGGFPALLAIVLRWTIPETPRYLIDITQKADIRANETRIPPDQELDRRATQIDMKFDKPGFWDDWHTDYKKGQGFRRMLAGTAICWFLMDVCFYGLGLDTPRTLAKIWGASSSDVTPDDNIYDALHGDVTRALLTIPLSSIPGSVVFLLLVNYIPRVTVLRWTFVALAILFVITGSSLTAVYETNNHTVTIVFYAFALFILNAGPNTILFMLPSELFPTKYRGTCYGIAAASGKAGAIIIQLIVHFQNITRPDSGKMQLAIMLMCFTPLMLIGAFVAWVWIPEVQHPRDPKHVDKQQKGKLKYRERMVMPSRSLEEITANPTEDHTFGLRYHLSELFGGGSKAEGSAV